MSRLTPSIYPVPSGEMGITTPSLISFFHSPNIYKVGTGRWAVLACQALKNNKITNVLVPLFQEKIVMFISSNFILLRNPIPWQLFSVRKCAEILLVEVCGTEKCVGDDNGRCHIVQWWNIWWPFIDVSLAPTRHNNGQSFLTMDELPARPSLRAYFLFFRKRMEKMRAKMKTLCTWNSIFSSGGFLFRQTHWKMFSILLDIGFPAFSTFCINSPFLPNFFEGTSKMTGSFLGERMSCMSMIHCSKYSHANEIGNNECLLIRTWDMLGKHSQDTIRTQVFKAIAQILFFDRDK